MTEKTGKTAGELADDLAAAAQELRQAAASEVRVEIAREIEHRFLERRGDDRTTYVGSPDDCLIEELTDNPVLQEIPALKALADRFADDGVSPDFRAGVLFAARLVADAGFEY